MIASQVIEMLQLQDKFNRKVNENWLTANYPWHRAVLVESTELLEHVGWKWWKAQTPDMDQARMEVIDIWHFVLSDALVENEGNIQKATLSVMENWTSPHRKIFLKDHEGNTTPIGTLDLLRKIELFGGLAAVSSTMLLPLLKLIAEELDMTFNDIYRMYLCKNALNHFRQEHGYKEGTYIKMWGDLEDNEVAMEIVANEVGLSYDGLLARLEEVYKDLTA